MSNTFTKKIIFVRHGEGDHLIVYIQVQLIDVFKYHKLF